MRHISVIQRLPFYVNDTLDNKKRAAMDEHLQGCADCREELKKMRIEIATLRELNADVEPLTDSAIRRAMHEKGAVDAAASELGCPAFSAPVAAQLRSQHPPERPKASTAVRDRPRLFMPAVLMERLASALAAAFRHLPQLSPSQRIVAMTAVLVIIGGIGFFIRRPPAEPTFRDTVSDSIQSLIGGAHPLPRDNFLLRWSGGPPGARYDLMVTTSELETLVLVRGLESPEYRIAPARLAGLASGERVLWRVVARAPDGGAISSSTFAVSVE